MKERKGTTISLAGESVCLKFNFETLCRIEERADRPIFDLVSGSLSLSTLLLLFWGALQHEREIEPEAAAQLLEGADLLSVKNVLVKELEAILAPTKAKPRAKRAA